MSADAVTTAFLYLAIAAAGGALAFLAGQRAGGRTPPEVARAHEEALLLESVAKDLATLDDAAARAAAPEDARHEIANARDELDDAVRTLRRGADLVV